MSKTLVMIFLALFFSVGCMPEPDADDNGIGRNVDELFRKVRAAQFIRENPDEVCPARWTPGAATLKPGLDLVGKI